MSGNNLAVKITADVVDLQAKFSVARAEVSGLTAEMNKLARASAQGIIDPAGAARLQQVTSDFVAAKTQVAALGQQLSTASAGVLGFSSRMNESHGSISTATREFRALFDELSSGRTRQTPGTLAILATRVFGLGPAALGAVAGVGALIGGLGYLAYRALEASKALSQIDLTSTFAGNLDITRGAIERYATSMATASNVSSSEARKIIAAFASIPGMTSASLATLSQSISAFAQETGQDADKAAEGLAKMFGEDVSAAEFAKKFGALTQLSQAQINQAQIADLSGNASQIMAQKLSILNQAITAASPALKEYKSNIFDSFSSFSTFIGLTQAGISGQEAMERTYKQQTQAIDAMTEARRQFLAVAAQTAPSSEQTLKVGVAAANAENPVSKQITEAQAKIAQMTAALGVAQERADQVNIDKLTAGLEKARENLNNLQFGPVLERMREQMGEVAANWDGTQSGMLQKQIQVAQSMLGEVRKNSKESLSIETEVARLEVEMKKATGAEVIAQARQRVSEIGTLEQTSAIGRLQTERSIWSQVLAGENLTTNQRIEVQRQLNTAVAQLGRERVAEAQTIARQDAAADLSISRLKIEAAKTAADTTVNLDQAAAARKLATLRELTAEEFSMNEAALQRELDDLKDQPAKYDATYNQIRELKARLVLDLEKLDRDYEESVKRLTKQEATAWRGAVGEIESAEGSFVSDMLGRRKSLTQSLLSIGQEFISREITNDLRAVTTRLLLHRSAEAQDKALEQGGFLYHQSIELQKAATTAHAQTAQTSATTAGNTARETATASAAAAGQAEAAATGPATVMADAAKAFSGTFAAIAQIPYVGPYIAPEAAAASYATVAAFAPQAALATGTNYVPEDMTARIHKGEAVIPKKYNPAAGGSGGGDTHLHMHMNGIDGPSIQNLVRSNAFHAEMTAMASRYFSRGGRG